ncbi:hypothetical protein UPYG_G00067320 [Umbra pygmaea]|uniref:C2H2-type domain-containing protein n=1 Tax=Umbra pygmaea TaxID=75934 RepID=A0ABD0XAR7_UMBPY
MSQMQLLRMFLNERLTAAVVEILEAVEKTVAEYEEENERLRRLLKNTPDIHHSLQFTLAVSEDEVATDPREWCPSPGQENPEPTKIKEEQEELWTSQQEKQLQGLDNDNLEFRFPPRVKSECDQQDEIQSLTLQQTETVENRACDFTTVHHTAFETHLKHLATPCNTLEHQNVFSNTSAVGSDPGFDNRSTLNPNPPMGEHYYQPNTTTSRTHRCSDCGEMFALKDDLQRHVTLAKKRPSECRLDSGTAHIWQAEKHCTCPFCGKTLKYKGDLSRHMRIHTDV